MIKRLGWLPFLFVLCACDDDIKFEGLVPGMIPLRQSILIKWEMGTCAIHVFKLDAGFLSELSATGPKFLDGATTPRDWPKKSDLRDLLLFEPWSSGPIFRSIGMQSQRNSKTFNVTDCIKVDPVLLHQYTRERIYFTCSKKTNWGPDDMLVILPEPGG